jgi:hypothetical protein
MQPISEIETNLVTYHNINQDSPYSPICPSHFTHFTVTDSRVLLLFAFLLSINIQTNQLNFFKKIGVTKIFKLKKYNFFFLIYHVNLKIILNLFVWFFSTSLFILVLVNRMKSAKNQFLN